MITKDFMLNLCPNHKSEQRILGTYYQVLRG